tara:strand:+ start:2696 stop:3286 length:591 start_codon:yes stop_codon:yes gene_type:complete
MKLTQDAPTDFLQAFNRLASTKGTLIDDTKHESYFETLGPLPIQAVVEAARQLQREDGPYLPAAGTWFRVADDLAADMLTKAATHAALLPRRVDEEEADEIRVARDQFVRQYEKLVGRTLPDTHRWKQEEIRVPSYACLTCLDTGWVEVAGTVADFRQAGEPVQRLSRCTCFATNATLEARRQHSTPTVTTRSRSR